MVIVLKINARTKKFKEDMICLKKTKTIKFKDQDKSPWRELKQEYNEVEDSLSAAIVTICNSILFQNRKFFTITRTELRNMIKEDKNHKKSYGIRNATYREVIAAITSMSFVKKIKDGKNKTPALYEVIDEELLKYINVDHSAQLQSALTFIENNIGDHNGDLEIDSVIDEELEYSLDKEKSLSNDNDKSNHPLILGKEWIKENNTKYKKIIDLNKFERKMINIYHPLNNYSPKQMQIFREIAAKIESFKEQAYLYEKEVEEYLAKTKPAILDAVQKNKIINEKMEKMKEMWNSQEEQRLKYNIPIEKFPPEYQLLAQPVSPEYLNDLIAITLLPDEDFF